MPPRAVILVLLLALTGCGRESEQPQPHAPWPAFDAAAAFSELENIVSFGSRAHGHPGHRHMTGYLQARLSAMGYSTRIQTFNGETSQGTKTFNNIEATIPGQGEGVIILSAHYDSMQGADEDFQAANSAGSAPAVLLEMARIIKERYDGKSEIRFVFFDGQEPFSQHSSADGRRGSSHYADTLKKNNEAENVTAVINLNMIGDRDLTVTIPKNVSNELRKRLLSASHEENARAHFKLMPFAIGDDHEPFYKLSIPAINIIDFEYGSSPGRNDYFRTTNDTLDKVSTESLDIAGRVTLKLLKNLSKSPAPH